MGAVPLRDVSKTGRKTTSTRARTRNLVFKGDTSLRGLVAALATGLSSGSRRNRSADEAVRKLLILARQARVSRDIEALDTISSLVLESFTDSPLAEVARFHKAHCLQARGDVAAGRQLLSEVVERAGPKFRARGLLALGTSYFEVGEYSQSLNLYLRAIRVADEADPLSLLQSMRSVAIVRGIEGDHSGSLSALQALLPQTLYLGRWYPADLYDHLNSIAIEMGELGRVDEATRIINRVLSTPFAKNCPHWLDTKLELATKPRLVFAPFTMSLGAPADLRRQNESAPSLKPVELEEAAESDLNPKTATPDASPENLALRVQSCSRECKRAVVIRRARAHESIAAALAIHFFVKPENNTVRLTFGAVHSKRGYAMSPPARAPPAR